MNKFIFIAYISIFQLTFAQNGFDYHTQFKSILANTKDPNSDFYYTKQLQKFDANDTLQTDKEMLSLLIGYTAKPEYNPNFNQNIANEIFKLNESGSYKEAFAKASKILQKDPFNLLVLIEMSYALTSLGKLEESKNYKYRMFKIYKAMFYSCNGNSNLNPLFALHFKDGQYFIKYFIRWQLGKISSDIDTNGNFNEILEAKNDSKSVTYHFILQHAKKKIVKK